MKRFAPFVIIGLTLVICVYAAFADNSFTAPYGFTISDPTVTSLTLAWSDSNDIAPDSVSVIDASDSTFYAYFGPATASQETTFLGLDPSKAYDLFVKTERGDTTHVSNKDTLTTNRPQIEPRRAITGLVRNMFGARSDRNDATTIVAATTYDSLYVPDATGLDSTMVYHTAPFMSIEAYVAGPHADSSLVNLMIYPGEAEETNLNQETSILQTGTWDFPISCPDSLVCTRLGWNPIWQPIIPPAEHFYIRADGQTDNGHTTKVILKLTRRWFEARP